MATRLVLGGVCGRGLHLLDEASIGEGSYGNRFCRPCKQASEHARYQVVAKQRADKRAAARGDLTIGQASVRTKFNNLLEASRRSPNECWPWAGKITALKYGRFGEAMAHRKVYESMVGPIPKGAMLLHSCDNPPCVNPGHLRPGTAQDNSNDCVERSRSAKGERNARAKLTAADAVEIVVRRLTLGETQSSLSSRFGVSEAAIRKLLRRESWSSETATTFAALQAITGADQ